MAEIDGVVHLWDLPEDKVFVRLKDGLQKLMVYKALKVAKTQKSLAENLSANKASILDFRNSRFQTIKLGFVKQLSMFLVKTGLKEFSLENIEKQIELIKSTKGGKSILNPKFPMNFNNKRGAQIIACIFFDGGITSSSLLPFYFNKENVLVDRMIENIKSIVGDIYYKKVKDKKNVFSVLFPQILGRILVNGLSLPIGQKVLKIPSLPTFVLTTGLELQKAFLQQAFDDEGSAKMSGCKTIQLSQHSSQKVPPIRLIQLKEMIERFGIRVNGPYFSGLRKTIKGYTSYGWSIHITNQTDTRLFEEKINFTLERQRNKLDNLLNSYTEPPRFRRRTAQEEFLKICEELKDGGIRITTKNVSGKIDRKERYVRRVLTKMVKANELKVIKEWGWNGRGSVPKEFEVV